jgi:predicted nucleic acid-binding protein
VIERVIYLLDTNAISDLMRADSRIETWLAAIGENDRVVTCTIVRGEILFGIARLPETKRRADIERKAHRLFEALPCEAVPEQAADFYAAIKSARQRRGLTLDENDLWVAATALAMDATLVSRDSDFAGIDGLSVLALS